MIKVAWWSLVLLIALGLVARLAVLAFKGTKDPVATLFGLTLEVWELIALFVWLRP